MITALSRPLTSVGEVSVWKTIKLGLCKSPIEYRAALKSANRIIHEWGNDILGKTICSQHEVEVDLAVVSVGELGFKNGAYYEGICTKGIEIGLERCPAEVGPALAVAYIDQPRGEWLCIAMDNIATRGAGHLEIFTVAHDDCGLYAACYNRDFPDAINVFSARDRFIFMRPKP